jgi:parallel beta-helix repeat protein
MLAFSDNSKIENVNALNNLFGISFFSSSNNTITNSTATNNGAIGIYLTLSSNNTITVNTFSNNRDWGIRLNSSSGNVLTNNEVSYNYGLLGGGIYLMYNSDNNVLADNDILDHYFGIRLRGFSENYPDDNKIYHNNFINNLIQAHALYGGTGNLFDDGYPSGGNYWSDYMGVDLYSGAGQNESGSDGIGDSHYTFTDGQDDYPFMEEDGWKAPERIRPDRAVELAKMVIGRDYKSEWGNSLTKGYFWNVINKKYIFLSSEEIEYLDCSGLSFWSYNRAYFDGKELLAEEFENRSLYYFGANGQYLGNIDKKLELTKEELRPGDLLFFDTWNRNTETYGQDGIMDHVAMHIGLHEGEQHAVEHAHVGEDDTDNAGKISVTTVDGLIDYYKARFGERAFVDFGRVIDAKVEMKFTGHSPIDLIVTDPDGETIYENVGQREAISELGDIGDNLTMSYMVYDIDGDGEPDDIVASPERKIGDYLITVVPEPGALPTDTYTLTVEALVNGEMATVVLAENVLISDIPRTPYIITSTETEITPIIPAFIDFNPDTLNLQSRGKWVTTYIELPRGYDINDIDSESIELNCQVPVETKPIEIGDYDSNGIPDLMVKFNQSAVQNILEVGDEVKLTLTGRLFDGTQYEGSDTIQVIRRGLLANLSILFASLHRAISQLLNLLQNNFFILWLES